MIFVFRTKTVVLLAILVASVALTGGVAVASREQQKPSREELARRAAQLLDRAPLLVPLPDDALSERAFMDQAEQLLGEHVDSVLDAVKELEELLRKGSSHRGNIVIRTVSKAMKVFVKDDDTQTVIGNVKPVTAVVTSVPSNLSVRYYRKVHPGQKLDAVTDTRNLELDPPAIWVFECTNKGVMQTQVKSCTSGCAAHFVF